MNKTRILSVLMAAAIMLCGCFSSDGDDFENSDNSSSSGGGETVKDYPTYENDFNIVFTAYASVPVELMNDEQFKNLSEAGFTKALGLYEGRVGLTEGMSESEIDKKITALKTKTSDDAKKALTLSEKYDVRYYVFNELIYNVERYTQNYDKYLKTLLSGEDYTSSSAFAGHFLADEPSLAEMKELTSAVKTYKKYLPSAEPFINLLPCEDKKSQANYKAYLDYYFSNLASDLGYISFDHYPYGEISGVDAMHLWNLEEISQRANQSNIEKRGFIWSNLTSNGLHRRITSAADIRLQAYTNLAYGVDEMTYFVYSSNGDSNDKTNALINYRTGKKSNAYIWAKAVNREIKAFEQAYGSFEWTGVMTFGENPQFAELTKNLSSCERIKSVESEADVLMGVFADNDGEFGAKDAFLVVNYGDPLNSAAKEKIEIEFADAARVMLYKNGKCEVLSLTDGKLSLDMAVGDGAFIIPLA